MAKIILTTDVANLGGPGDIVEVKDGYARNYLLPRGYAIAASKGAREAGRAPSSARRRAVGSATSTTPRRSRRRWRASAPSS